MSEANTSSDEMDFPDHKKESREELHRRVEMLREFIESGRLKFASHLADEFWESLSKIRVDSSGLVLPDTVDGRVRAATLAVSQLTYRNELKSKVSLGETQEAYFKIIHDNFSHFYDLMVERGSDPHSFAKAASKNPEARGDLSGPIPDFIEAIREFWESCGEAISVHISDTQQLKAVFGGDLFPSYAKNIVSTCGLYVDTIILPCPFLRSADLFRIWDEENQVYYLMKHGLNLLRFRDAALADVNPPMVVVMPEMWLMQEGYGNFIADLGKRDGLLHAGRLFGRQFNDVDDAGDFFKQFVTPNDVANALVQQDRLLFDTEWDGPVEDQIARYISTYTAPYAAELGNHTGRLVLTHAFNRMTQANDLLQRSHQLGGAPIIEAETSWRYFTWMLEYNSDVDPESRKHLHMTRGLQYGFQTEISWLGNIPLDDLIEIRRSGAADEIRETLSKGISEIAKANPSGFYRSADKIMDNINAEFEKHEAKLREFRDKKLRLFGVDIPACLAVGSIAVTAAILQNPILGAIAGAAGIIGLPSAREVIADLQAVRSGKKEADRTPIGILFKHSR